MQEMLATVWLTLRRGFEVADQTSESVNLIKRAGDASVIIGDS